MASDEHLELQDLLKRWRMNQGDVPQFTNDRQNCRVIRRDDIFTSPAPVCWVYPGTKAGETFLVWAFWAGDKAQFTEILAKYVRLAPHPAMPRFVGYCEKGDDRMIVTDGDFSRIGDKLFGAWGETQPPPDLDATRKAKAIFGVVAALVHMESYGIWPYLELEENIMFDRNWEVRVAYDFRDVEFEGGSGLDRPTLWEAVGRYGWGYTFVWLISLLLRFNPSVDYPVPCNYSEYFSEIQFDIPAGVHPLLRAIVQSADVSRGNDCLNAVPYTPMDVFQALLRLKQCRTLPWMFSRPCSDSRTLLLRVLI